MEIYLKFYGLCEGIATEVDKKVFYSAVKTVCSIDCTFMQLSFDTRLRCAECFLIARGPEKIVKSMSDAYWRDWLQNRCANVSLDEKIPSSWREKIETLAYEITYECPSIPVSLALVNNRVIFSSIQITFYNNLVYFKNLFVTYIQTYCYSTLVSYILQKSEFHFAQWNL